MNEDNFYHKKASGNLAIAFFLNLVLNIIVIIGGALTNSVAVLADALHDLSDTFSIFIAWLLEKLSQKDSDDHFTYGYKRFSVFGAVITSVVVIIASGIIIWESYTRLFTTLSPNASGMLIVAILGILFKGVAVLRLNGGKTFNEKAISIHLLGDVFRWVAVLIIAIILMFVNVPILDPLVSIVISIWVIYNLAKTLIDSVKVLLQGTPKEINLTDLEHDFYTIANVEDVLDLHVWTSDGIDNILTAKIKISIDDVGGTNEIKHELERVAYFYGIKFTTFEFDYDFDLF